MRVRRPRRPQGEAGILLYGQNPDPVGTTGFLDPAQSPCPARNSQRLPPFQDFVTKHGNANSR